MPRGFFAYIVTDPLETKLKRQVREDLDSEEGACG
jgi:hypothetical protein